MSTRRADRTCEDKIKWWRVNGNILFPRLLILACDTLMGMALSVPAESTFSDIGDIVRPERTRLSDEHIPVLVLLQSSNRFRVVFSQYNL